MKSARILAIAVFLAPVCRAENSAELANKILELSGASESIRESFEGVIKPSLDQMRAQGAPAELVDSIEAEARKFFSDNFNWEEVRPQVVLLFTDAFTESELRDFYSFYKTPTGQKVFSKLPVLRQQTVAVAMSGVRAKMPEFQERVNAMIRDYQKKAEDAAKASTAAPAQQPSK
jgi:hypothetical protein